MRQEKIASMPVIYITGLSHSGTTLLSMLLGAHSQITNVGEAKVLSTSYRERSIAKYKSSSALVNQCSCGASIIDECASWQKVDQYLQQKSLSLERLDLYSADAAIFRLHNSLFFDALQATLGNHYLVDSSKDLKRLNTLLTETQVPIRTIFIQRKLEGVLYSHIRRNGHLHAYWFRQLVQATLKLQRLRALLSAHEHLSIQYEDLAATPDKTMSEVFQWLGLPDEPTWQTWATQEHHLAAGNRMRFGQNSQITLDERWQDGLSPLQKFACRIGHTVSYDRWASHKLIGAMNRILLKG